MLSHKASSAILAVSDIARARKFYTEVLGLELVDDRMEGVFGLRTGDTRLIVYQSAEAGTNRANAVVWSCGEEIDSIVAELERKGVAFEHYPELGGMRLVGNMHVADEMKMVWFKDPDGNLLHLNNM